VYAACTQECVSSAFDASGTSQIKDLACYQYLGKFNSVPGHHLQTRLAPIGTKTHQEKAAGICQISAAIERKSREQQP
jgi:hypothetical protein